MGDDGRCERPGGVGVVEGVADGVCDGAGVDGVLGVLGVLDGVPDGVSDGVLEGVDGLGDALDGVLGAWVGDGLVGAGVELGLVGAELVAVGPVGVVAEGLVFSVRDPPVVRGGEGAPSTGGWAVGVGDQLGIGISGFPTGKGGRVLDLDVPSVRSTTEGDAVAGVCVLVG